MLFHILCAIELIVLFITQHNMDTVVDVITIHSFRTQILFQRSFTDMDVKCGTSIETIYKSLRNDKYRKGNTCVAALW